MVRQQSRQCHAYLWGIGVILEADFGRVDKRRVAVASAIRPYLPPAARLHLMRTRKEKKTRKIGIYSGIGGGGVESTSQRRKYKSTSKVQVNTRQGRRKAHNRALSRDSTDASSRADAAAPDLAQHPNVHRQRATIRPTVTPSRPQHEPTGPALVSPCPNSTP